MNYLSLCSGIEAASVAWHPLGWNCVGVSEIEPFPCAVLAHRFPNVKNYGDMTKFTDWKIPDGTVDLLAAGTPCQSFSVAGLRQGLKDPRGNLMLTFLAIAASTRPRWIVWENVPGVLSSNGGKDFATFVTALGQLGYGWAYRVLDAQWVRTHGHPRAVPQRRRRVFVVGCFGDATAAAKVLFEHQSVSRNTAKGRAQRQGTSADVAACIRSGGDGGVPSSRGEHLIPEVSTVDARNNFDRGDSQHLDRLIPCWWDGGDVASTLTKQNANGAQRMPDKDNFGAVLQSSAGGSTVIQPLVIPIMPQAMQAEGWRVGKENQDGRGNGLGVGKNGDPCPTLDCGAVPAVAIVQPSADVFTKSKRAQSSTDDETWVDGKVAPTLSVFDQGDIRATVAIVQPIGVVAIQGTTIGRQDHNGPAGCGHSISGEMFTLNATDQHAVAIVQPSGVVAPTLYENHPADSRVTGPHDVAPSCVARQGTGGGNLPFVVAPKIVGQVDWRTTNNDAGQVSQTLKTDLAHQSDPCLAIAQPSAIGTDCYNGSITGDVAATISTAGSSVNASGPTVMAFKPGQSAKARSLGAQVNVACTLEAGGGGNNKQAVVCPTLTAHNDPSRSPQSSEITQQVAAVHASSMSVRRLTPNECERLQGFPDDFTLIPYRGKSAENCPDGARYKALGNSMAVNCMEWIGQRIDALHNAT